MPIYEYQCSTCENTFSRILSMDNMNKPITEPCPECSSIDTVKKVILQAPSLTAAVNVTNKIPHHFKDKLREIKKDRAVGGNLDHLI